MFSRREALAAAGVVAGATALPGSVQYTASMLKDGDGKPIPVRSNDNAGARHFNAFNEPDTWYVFGWGGQSLNGGQASLLHLPKSLSATEREAITARTYRPVTLTSENPDPDRVLMPDCGSVILGKNVTGFRPLGEYRKIPDYSQTPSGETPVSQALFTFFRQLRVDFPQDPAPTLIGLNYAVGSSSIVNVGPGRPAWNDLQRAMSAITRLAKNAGKRVQFVTEIYRGFEADWDIALHADATNRDPHDPSIIRGRERDALMRMMADRRVRLEEALLPLTGQKQRIRLLFDQLQHGASSYKDATHEPRATAAQLDIHTFDPLCCAMGSKSGIPENILDFIHPSPHGYAWLGQFDGNILYRHLSTVEGHQPLKVARFWQIEARVFGVRFNRHIELLTDDSVITVSTLGPGKGLMIVDGEGESVPISNIERSDPDSLRLETSADPRGFAPLKLNVALNSNRNHRGNRNGARSAVVAERPLSHVTHQPPVFSGELNDEGAAWPSYPPLMPIYETAAHQQVVIS
ncbi:hypothetical protein [Sphingomonas faeni]|uniref:hypothetical protein n=1 Tax=Sphingomonas faeni TaxID=185950 RepID=UPI0033556E15